MCVMMIVCCFPCPFVFFLFLGGTLCWRGCHSHLYSCRRIRLPLVYSSVDHHTLPKRLSPSLVHCHHSAVLSTSTTYGHLAQCSPGILVCSIETCVWLLYCDMHFLWGIIFGFHSGFRQLVQPTPHSNIVRFIAGFPWSSLDSRLCCL